MDITEELRRYARGYKPLVDHTLLEIADRIDEEHESACAEAYGNGVESVELPDMANYVKLPVDANDEILYVGDTVVLPNGANEKVWFLLLNSSGWSINSRGWVPSKLTHYRHSSVENILKEFGEEWSATLEDYEMDALIAEYADKLQLREDA